MNELPKLLHDSRGIQSGDSQAERCRNMWGKVVLNEVLAALWEGNTCNSKGYPSPAEFARRHADSWLRNCGRDMREVCDLAGIDPEFLSQAYISGRIKKAVLEKPELAEVAA